MLQELAESLPTPAKIRQHPGLYDKIPAYAPIAQLDRALASGARGRKFEPCWARHKDLSASNLHSEVAGFFDANYLGVTESVTLEGNSRPFQVYQHAE